MSKKMKKKEIRKLLLDLIIASTSFTRDKSINEEEFVKELDRVKNQLKK